MRLVAVTLGLGFSLISTAHAVPLKYDYSAPPSLSCHDQQHAGDVLNSLLSLKLALMNGANHAVFGLETAISHRPECGEDRLGDQIGSVLNNPLLNDTPSSDPSSDPPLDDRIANSIT